MSPQQTLTTLMTRIVVDKSTFVFYQNINVKENVFFFSERELKKALRDTLTEAAWSGLFSTSAN